MVVILTSMDADGRHCIRIGPAIQMATPEEGAETAEIARYVRINTERCNQALGDQIEAWRDQWVWFHPRWDELP